MNNDPHDEINHLCDIVRETSFEIHKYLRSGHLERIYENALAHRLRKKGVHVKQQFPIQVLDEDGTLLGSFWLICLLTADSSANSKGADFWLMNTSLNC